MNKKQYLELEDGSSRKFWEITLDANDVLTRWGRIGTKGQQKTKSFDDASDAAKAYAKQLAGKEAKGYALVTGKAKAAPAKKVTSKKTSTKKASAKTASSKKAGAKAAATGRFVERVLHVQGAKAKKLTKLWRSSKTTDEALEETLGLLGKALSPGNVPAWLKLDDDTVLGTMVHLAAPAFVANPDDEDELWGRSDEQVMTIVDLPGGKVHRSDGEGNSKESKLTKAHLPIIDAVEYADSNPMAGLVWRDVAPGTLPAFKKWVVALAAAAGGDVEPYDASEYDATPAKPAPAALMAGPSVHGNGGLGRTNAFEGAGPRKPPKKRWVTEDQVAGGGEYGGDPVVCDGVVYGTKGNWVEASAVTVKGKILWTTQLSKAQNWSTDATCVAGGVAYFPTKEGVHALDAKTGNKRWLARCKGGASSPLCVDGVVVFGGKGELIAVSPETGRKAWRHPVHVNEKVGPPAYFDGVIYALAVDGKTHKTSRLVAVEAATGQVVFEQKTPWLWGVAPPMVVGGTLFCTIARGELAALDPKTGKKLWHIPVAAKQLAATEDILVARTDEGLRAFDLRKKGKRLWIDEPSNHYDIGRAGPCIAGGAIYLTRTFADEEYGEQTFLQALELKTGKELWRVSREKLKLNPFSWYVTPCVVDGVLFVQTYELVALA